MWLQSLVRFFFFEQKKVICIDKAHDQHHCDGVNCKGQNYCGNENKNRSKVECEREKKG